MHHPPQFDSDGHTRARARTGVHASWSRPAEKKQLSLIERKKRRRGRPSCSSTLPGLTHKIRARGSIEYEEAFAWRFIRSNELTQGKS